MTKRKRVDPNDNKSPYESVQRFYETTDNEYIPQSVWKDFQKFVPRVSTDLFLACDTAGWYWNLRDVNKYADKDNLVNVSAAINNPSAINTANPNSTIRSYTDRENAIAWIKQVSNYENCK